MLKTIAKKKPPKEERHNQVLFGLIELYLKLGAPVGSQTLRDEGFQHLSSATLRNYFAKLEEQGLLKQQHSSGGRIPTPQAFKLYAEAYFNAPQVDAKEEETLKKSMKRESRAVATYLQEIAETLSEAARLPVFLSSPHLEQDLVLDVRLVPIDTKRALCVLITDFGMIRTEILYSEKRIPNLGRIEEYFRFRLTGRDRPTLSAEEERIAVRFYQEVMLRHLLSSHASAPDTLFHTGFAKLLSYPDFNDATALASGLALLENPAELQSLLRTACQSGEMLCLVGENPIPACSVIAVPYFINQTVAGAIAVLGPHRIPYRRLFGLLRTVSTLVSESLTRSLYKFKIPFRAPNGKTELGSTTALLLEDKTP